MQLEKSAQIIYTADGNGRKPEHILMVDVEMGREEVLGGEGEGSERRSFQKSIERTHPNITVQTQAISPQMREFHQTRNVVLNDMKQPAAEEEDFTLLPRKNRSSLRYAAMTNSYVKGGEVGEGVWGKKRESSMGKIEKVSTEQDLSQMASSGAKSGALTLEIDGASSNSEEQSDESSSPGTKRRARLNTIYKKPVQRRRRKSFHGMDKMLHQQEHQSPKRMYTMPDFAARAMQDSPPTRRTGGGGSSREGSPVSGGGELGMGMGRSPMDLHIVDHFLADEGVKNREKGPLIHQDGSPSRWKVEAFAVQSTNHLRQREGGLDFQLKNLGTVLRGQDALKMDGDLESSFNAELSFDEDEGGLEGEVGRDEYRKHRATFEVGFLEKMRESLDMGGVGGDDDEMEADGGMSQLDDFLAEEEGGGSGVRRPRRSSKPSPKKAFGLDTIIGSPVSPTRTMNWGGRGGGGEGKGGDAVSPTEFNRK
ncbi:hypothetical protein TL16_g01842 [Triparma laevis f. inornata]|uniref:Uncharacterized protein n=1 Tax=Triparma laevis f. inornata TaxID=1714386 RepID=A0A9W6ZQA2_9STRA|nr:hypothetical protein TL16_g01842 [Triparma laevis f. inornata]